MAQATPFILACCGQSTCITVRVGELRVHQSYLHCLQQRSHLFRMLDVLTCKGLSGGKQWNQILHESTQVAGKEMYTSSISDDVTLAPNALFKVIKCGCN